MRCRRLRVGRALGVPVVYEVRAFWEDAAVDHGTNREGGPRYRATRALETYALQARRARDDDLRRPASSDIVARGIPESRITVIPNAVDVDAFEFGAVRDDALAARLGLADATVVGFIGSFYAYEGLVLLLARCRACCSAGPTCACCWSAAVRGSGRSQALAGELGVRDKIVFTGRVPHAEVQRYYGLDRRARLPAAVDAAHRARDAAEAAGSDGAGTSCWSRPTSAVTAS